jgi:hypothetical protein
LLAVAVESDKAYIDVDHIFECTQPLQNLIECGGGRGREDVGGAGDAWLV